MNVGTSADIFQYTTNNNKVLSFGADLFTFTKLRSEKEFHFPVEAIDYLFGVNAGYKIENNNCEYGARFRLSHISAHFVDGQYDYAKNIWRNGINPHTYSREFLELFPYYKINSLRVYTGLTYLFHVNPNYVGKGIYQLGFDYFLPGLFKYPVTPFAADDFKLQKIGNFTGSNILSIGLKFGIYNKKGFSTIIFILFGQKHSW